MASAIPSSLPQLSSPPEAANLVFCDQLKDLVESVRIHVSAEAKTVEEMEAIYPDVDRLVSLIQKDLEVVKKHFYDDEEAKSHKPIALSDYLNRILTNIKDLERDFLSTGGLLLIFAHTLQFKYAHTNGNRNDRLWSNFIRDCKEDILTYLLEDETLTSKGRDDLNHICDLFKANRTGEALSKLIQAKPESFFSHEFSINTFKSMQGCFEMIVGIMSFSPSPPPRMRTLFFAGSVSPPAHDKRSITPAG